MVNRARDDSDGACLTELRQMVLTGELLPGEKLNQADLADRLGVSRVPVREALASLRSEGLVESRAQTGYTVVRPTVEDLAELYTMRGLLENTLLESVVLERVDLDLLAELNADLAVIDPAADFSGFRATNEQFHRAIWDCSPQRMIRREVERLWVLSEFYRGIYIRVHEGRSRVIDEHHRIIDAIRRGDRTDLIEQSAAHRAETETWTARVLGRR